MTNEIQFTQVNNDGSGNPRYVCHFLNFINDNDRLEAEKNTSDTFKTNTLYSIALRKAKKIHGRKFHNKQYGGGIVFTDIPQYLEPQIIKLKNS